MRVKLIVLLCGVSLVGVDAARAEEAPPCATRDVEYSLTGTLRLAETPFGKGDGAYKIGPGTAVLRYHPGGRVSLVSYSMRENFSVVATAFFSTMTVVTATDTKATPNACGVAAEGTWKGNQVQWATKVRGVRTDGTLQCTGKFCGTNGAPPAGLTELHLGPEDAKFRAWEFSTDGKTFTMPYTFAAKTEVPKQTSYVALTGREVKRTCVAPPKPCTP